MSTTLEICPALLGKLSTLKTGILCERVWVFIPFKQTKSLSMRLPVAPQSRRASTEYSLLMSIVSISTGRSKEVPYASKALIERSLGSLFSHLGLQSGAETRGIGDGTSTSSLSIVLGSSIVNTVNLFTGDKGTLITGHAMQNPLPPGDKTLQSELHLSTPTDLQSTPPATLWWVDGCPCSGDNPGLHSLHLCIGSILAEARTLLS